jgi:7-cyano-7-deazaguanine reductase
MSDTADLTLLGRSENRLPTSPDEAQLETFANRLPGRNYTIHLTTHDFSSLCPVTGQPDSAHLEIYYIPGDRCIETKSLKFRNTASFNEDIVNRILDDIVKACAPRQCIVRGKFSPRGGIQLTCEARHPDRTGPLELS